MIKNPTIYTLAEGKVISIINEEMPTITEFLNAT